MRDYPDFIIANAYVKLAAAQTNHSLGVINDEIAGAMSEACREIIDGKWHENFPIDMIQGETINDMLKNTAQIVHSRHRSVNNFVMNLISCNLWIGESAPSCFFFICRLNIYSH